MPGLPKRWGQRQREALEDALQAGDLVEMLAVAEQVSQRLGAPLGGEYVGWLRQSLCPETLPLKDEAVIRALDALDVPLVTTNYDDLIERVTGLQGVTWQQRHKIPRVLRGEDRAVLHLHGKWDEPASVVLGIRDYESVKSDEHTQAVMHALGITRSLLFVGCGEGLKDPNFANFFRGWAASGRPTNTATTAWHGTRRRRNCNGSIRRSSACWCCPTANSSRICPVFSTRCGRRRRPALPRRGPRRRSVPRWTRTSASCATSMPACR